jgi:Na+/proline symporter
MLLGAWSRASQSGAILGCILGLFTILIYGWSVGKTFQAGFEWFLLPEGLYSYNSMMTFIFCLIIPIVVTIVASLALPQTSPNRSSYNPPTSPRAFVDLKSPKSLGDFV